MSTAPADTSQPTDPITALGSPPSDAELAALRALAPQELIARYRFGVGHLDQRMLEMDIEQLDTAFLPEAGIGRWPIRVVLGHLADEELSSVHRIRRIIAEEGPVLAEWDENAFIDSDLYTTLGGDEGPNIGGFLAVIYTLRTWNAELLASLDEDQWNRKAMHPTYGERTIREIAEYSVWHMQRHAWFINAKVTKILGPKASGGCCGGACKEEGGSSCCASEGSADSGGCCGGN